MSLRQPASMWECIYFTRRSSGKGKIKTWVFKEKCPECGKALMGKPKDPKTGKLKIRAKEYMCPGCNYTIEQKKYEESLVANIEYTCPYCAHESETQIPFKRKKVKIFDDDGQKEKTVDALQFLCSKCGKKINITKKMK